MKTITIKKVRDAYKNTGITMVTCRTLNSRTCMACPMAVLYFDSHPQVLVSFKKNKDSFRGKLVDDNVFIWANKKFGKDYVDGFVDGVDAGPQYIFSMDGNKGFKEGQDILKALSK